MHEVSPVGVLRLLNVVLCSVALTGCPQLQKDEFKVVAEHNDAGTPDATGGMISVAGSGGVNNYDAGAGGTSRDSGNSENTGGAGNDDAGISETGGTTSSSGAGGVSSSGGTSGTSEVGGADNSGGTTGFDGTGGTSEVGGTTGSGGTCAFGPFANPELITGLNIQGELWGPTLSADGLTLYFSAWDGSTDRIYVTTRAARGSEFEAAVELTIGGAPPTAATPCLSYSGLNLYFVANARQGSSDKDLWVASRQDTFVASFTNAQSLVTINSTDTDNRPWLSDDELTLYFSSARQGGTGDFDIWMATRPSVVESFSSPVNLETLNSISRDESPVLSKDGLTMYFASSRQGGLGKQDIYSATRSNASSDFGAPTPLTALNSMQIETDLALSHDETEIFFASNSSGTPQIWRAMRSCVAASP